MSPYGEHHESCENTSDHSYTCVPATTFEPPSEFAHPPTQFLHVSGGSGNTKSDKEIHIQFHNYSGKVHQAWFKVEDLMSAMAEHEDGKHTVTWTKQKMKEGSL